MNNSKKDYILSFLELIEYNFNVLGFGKRTLFEYNFYFGIWEKNNLKLIAILN